MILYKSLPTSIIPITGGDPGGSLDEEVIRSEVDLSMGMVVADQVSVSSAKKASRPQICAGTGLISMVVSKLVQPCPPNVIAESMYISHSRWVWVLKGREMAPPDQS